MEKNLSQSQRRILQMGVFIVLGAFLILFFLSRKNVAEKNSSVTLSGNKLQVFDDEYEFNGYPDKILMHYPYFMLVQANKPLTIVYDLNKKTKVKEIKDVILDYYEGNIIYNRKESYYNNKNLGEYCDAAFIKNVKEMLCITRKSRDSADNMLLSMNPESPNLAKREYESNRILTGVYFINNQLFVSEIDSKSMQNYISIDGNVVPIENNANVVFPKGNSVFYVTYPKDLKTENPSFYKIERDGVISVKGDITFKR